MEELGRSTAVVLTWRAAEGPQNIQEMAVRARHSPEGEDALVLEYYRCG